MPFLSLLTDVLLNFSKASKEWVIQPKPKPGRKPKKDTALTTKDEDEVGSALFLLRLSLTCHLVRREGASSPE
jgi:hypothetical protein